MPWSVEKPPKVALHWTEDERRACVEAANRVLAETGDEQGAIFACIHAAGKAADDKEGAPVAMEHKVVPFRLTKIDGEGRTFEGYAATFGNLDLVGDVIHPGAFAKTLHERGAKVRILWQHDTHEPIGRPVELHEDGRGLFVKAIISDTMRGRDALALLKDGAIDSMSIGYDAIAGGTDYSKGPDGHPVRNLKEIRLYEISLVSFPANEEARVLALKAAIPAHTTTKAADDTAWDAATVMGECEGATQLRKVCAWVDPDGDPESKSSYKLPHHMANGEVVLKGVQAAGGVLQGARGGASIPESDLAGVRAHLGAHYRQFDATPPWEDEGKAAPEPDEVKIGRRISKTTRAHIQSAIEALSALLAEEQQAAEEAEETESEKAAPEPETAEAAASDSDSADKAGPETAPPTEEKAVGSDVTPPPSTSAESATPDQAADPFADYEASVKRITAILARKAGGGECPQ